MKSIGLTVDCSDEQEDAVRGTLEGVKKLLQGMGYTVYIQNWFVSSKEIKKPKIDCGCGEGTSCSRCN